MKAKANEDTLLRTHCWRHKCFPVCPRAQHLLRTQLLSPGHKKCFWFCSETFCVRNKCFPVCAAQETSWATMCPQQCVLVCQGLNASDHLQKKYVKLAVVIHVSSSYAKLCHFTLLFCRGKQRNVQRIITHVHSYCSAHLTLTLVGGVLEREDHLNCRCRRGNFTSTLSFTVHENGANSWSGVDVSLGSISAALSCSFPEQRLVIEPKRSRQV